MVLETAELASALRQAKKKTMFFVFVAKGTDGALNVDKKKIPNKVANEMKKEVGGGLIYKGNCLYEENTLVFEVAKEPPATLAAQIKKIIKRDASLTLNVVVRANGALAEEEGLANGEAPEQEEEAIPDAPPIADERPPGPPSLALKFETRLKALTPVLTAAEKIGGTLVVQAKQRIAEGTKQFETQAYALANTALDHAEAFLKQAFASQTPADVPAPLTKGNLALKFADRLKAMAPVITQVAGIANAHAKDAKLALAEANMLFRAKNYEDANVALDVVEELVKEAFAANKGAPPPPPHPDLDAARIAERLKALVPVVAKAESTGSDFARQAKVKIADANKLYVVRQYSEANAALDEAEVLLKQAFSGARAKASTGSMSIIKLGKARVEWLGARSKAITDLQRLRDTIQAEFAADAEQQTQLAAALSRLDGLVTSFSEELGDQLDAVLNAKDVGQRETLAGAARATMNRFLLFAQNDPLMKAIDGNEFIPGMQVTAPLQAKLRDIATALA